MESIREGLDGFYIPSTAERIKSQHITEPMGYVGFTITLYFRGGHLPEVQEKACECIKEYIDITGANIQTYAKGVKLIKRSENGLPVLDMEQILKCKEKREDAVCYIASSNTTKKEYELYPPRYLVLLLLKLLQIDKEINCLIASFAPSFFLLDSPPVSFVDLVCQWCQRLRPVSGTAGWGITRPIEPIPAMCIEPFIAPYLLRFPGLDMPSPINSSLFGEHIANINWLTIVNDKLIERIGGIGQIKSLGDDFGIAEYPGGHIIQAGPKPEIGDTDMDDIPYYYGKLQDKVMPLYLPIDKLGYVVGAVLPPDATADNMPNHIGYGSVAKRQLHEFLEQWLHRFDKDWIKKRKRI